mmetsp:Transcript_17699/g.38702  ORF Transcript_17699/g.38702 Transcript_17699/m.38702 type:complete len:281 (-) Transcript_17699:307-1149(-)
MPAGCPASSRGLMSMMMIRFPFLRCRYTARQGLVQATGTVPYGKSIAKRKKVPSLGPKSHVPRWIIRLLAFVESLLQLLGQSVARVGPLSAPIDQGCPHTINCHAPDRIRYGIGQKVFDVRHCGFGEMKLVFSAARYTVNVVVVVVVVKIIIVANIVFIDNPTNRLFCRRVASSSSLGGSGHVSLLEQCRMSLEPIQLRRHYGQSSIGQVNIPPKDAFFFAGTSSSNVCNVVVVVRHHRGIDTSHHPRRIAKDPLHGIEVASTPQRLSDYLLTAAGSAVR